MVIVAAIQHADDAHIVTAAGELADAFDDDLHVVSVLDVESPPADIGGVDAASTERLRDAAESRAREAAEAAGADATPVGLVGEDVTRELVDYADEHDARYLVIGGRKRTPVGKALFGSVTQSILLHADRPVLTVMDTSVTSRAR